MAIPLKEFKELAGCYGLVPVCEDLPVDLDTPVSVFKKVATGRYTYILESVEGGEQLARYSLIGFDPLVVIRARDERVLIEDGGGRRILTGEPLEVLKRVMEGLRAAPVPGGERFLGGAVGYFGYDLVRHYERLPSKTVDDLGLPDCCLVITRVVLVYDHVGHNLRIVVYAPASQPSGYQQALATISLIRERLQEQLRRGQSDGLRSGKIASPTVANLSRERFIANVLRAKEHIKAGDIFQVVLSQRIQRECAGEPLAVYLALRSLNPSPYLFYLNFGDLQLVGSSPEMLIRVEDGMVETRPIAGTRPRGATPEEDEALSGELQDDPKERAEHVMLVDLGRNDLGRVCRCGSVRLARFMEIERYSHVMHLVSAVRGELAQGKDAYDALRACFPAGTVSGAPKVRAMEIIEDLEPTRRGPYAGAVGYLGFNGNLDSCIAIRTILIKGGAAYIQAGAGIVADSDPEREYEETLNKAGALLQALNLAEGGGRG